jgi:transposase
MKGKRHTPEQIIKKLRTIEGAQGEGKSIAEACKQQAISEATYHRWQKQYRGMDEPTLKQFKELQKQNTELKKMVAEQALDIRILKEVAEGKW